MESTSPAIVMAAPAEAPKRTPEEIARNIAVLKLFQPNASDAWLEAQQVAQQYPGAYVTNSRDTPSMLGTGYRDNIVIAPMDDYQEGDDAVYDGGQGHLILHRITAKKPGYYFFKGIFNQTADGWIPMDKIKGKVVHPKRKM